MDLVTERQNVRIQLSTGKTGKRQKWNETPPVPTPEVLTPSKHTPHSPFAKLPQEHPRPGAWIAVQFDMTLDFSLKLLLDLLLFMELREEQGFSHERALLGSCAALERVTMCTSCTDKGVSVVSQRHRRSVKPQLWVEHISQLERKAALEFHWSIWTTLWWWDTSTTRAALANLHNNSSGVPTHG